MTDEDLHIIANNNSPMGGRMKRMDSFFAISAFFFVDRIERTLCTKRKATANNLITAIGAVAERKLLCQSSTLVFDVAKNAHDLAIVAEPFTSGQLRIWADESAIY